MESQEGKFNSEFDDKIFDFFKDFMTRITEFEELMAVGSRLLNGFQQGLEFLRRPPIDNASELVKNIINSNETKRLQSYLEAGCINTHDGVQNISKLHTFHVGLNDYLSKGKGILNQLDSLMEDVICALQTTEGNLPLISDKNLAGGTEGVTADDEETAPSGLEKHQDTDLAVLMGIIYSMVKQDYSMQERIISSLSLKSSSEELESYSLMWSLRPYVNDDIMHQAWKLIP